MLDSFRNSLLSVIYPQTCMVCRSAGAAVGGPSCDECWNLTRIFDGSEMLCGKCGILLGEKAPSNPVFCHKCDGHSYDSAFSVGVYEKALAAAVIHLKTNPNIGDQTASLVFSVFDRARVEHIDLIIPVPLAAQRRFERGFNQADVIARLVARTISAEVDPHSLTRHKHTPLHRIGMDDKARALTVAKAFKVVRPKLVAGKNVLLVDDVMTSGATTSACAAVLKKAGALRVDVFTLARAVMRF